MALRLRYASARPLPIELVFEYPEHVSTQAATHVPPTVVTVETNSGGHLLVATVRDALAHLPVRVVPIVRTGRNRP